MTRFKPKKSLGQNFLVDPHVRKKIIGACDLNKDDIVLEIGPGGGALTQEISKCAGRVFAVEKDDRLADWLKEQFQATNVTIIHDDILKFPWEGLPHKMKLIGNLPYNISTPIIERILGHKEKFDVVFVTVQLEYGMRLCAVPDTKDYGRLSCFAQYHTDIHRLFKIKSTAFRPIPKVDSCFLRLDILARPRVLVDNEELLFEIIRSSFEQRRKMIRNSLASAVGVQGIDGFLNGIGIAPQLRAGNLTLEDYARLTNAVAGMRG
jgi:16S rRNA (adenine1518-N6/adenine1519-N6)-dimethyltransferase